MNNKKTEGIVNFFRKIIEYKHIELLSVILYKIVLDCIYLLFMKDSNSVYYVVDFNIYKCVFSYIIAIILYKLILKVKIFIIRVIIKIFYLLMFIPISTVYMARNFNTTWYLFIFVEFLIIIYTTKIIQKLFNHEKISIIKKKFKYKINYSFSTKFIYYIFVVSAFLILFLCIYYNRFPQLRAFNLNNVYKVREEFYLPKLARYLYVFEIKFILPFLTVLYLHKKSYVRLIITIIVQLMIFLIKADKIVLFSIPLVIGVYFIFKYYKKINIEKYCPLLLALACLFAMIAYNFNTMILGMCVTRLLITPANLKFIYLDFFYENEKIGIVGTVLNAIFNIKNPYETTYYQNLIGQIYSGKSTNYANTGFLVEGYVRFGYIGFIILPIITAIVLYIINHGSKKNGIAFTLAIAVFPLMNLNDSYILPSLLFGGILLLVIVSMFFDVNELKIKPSKILNFRNKTI